MYHRQHKNDDSAHKYYSILQIRPIRIIGANFFCGNMINKPRPTRDFAAHDFEMGNQVSSSVCAPPALTAVTFTLNGRAVTVDNVSPLITLNDWLRSQPGLTGTKRMCGEGGCGVCVVTVTINNPATDREITLAINSVLHYLVLCTFTCSNTMGDVELVIEL